MNLSQLHEIQIRASHRLMSYCLPTLAVDPPTIRLLETFEYPHPSCGVNKRPLISVLTTICDAVVASPIE